jgi:hypothetical protein
MFYDFLARGFVHFDFEVEKIVVIFNKERQKRFEQKLQQFSWEDRGRTAANSKEKDLLNVETDQGRQRQRTLASFEEYVAKIPGSERTNLVMAWHAHERKNLYSNAVNGHFIPPPVAPDLIEAIKAGTTGPPKVDVGKKT